MRFVFELDPWAGDAGAPRESERRSVERGGPSALLDRVALHVGVAPPAPSLSRALSLAGDLALLDGPWRASLELDPLGAASRLLDLADDLHLDAVEEVHAARWIRDLLAATRDTEGPADVARRVLARLPRHDLSSWTIQLDEAPVHLPRAFARLVDALDTAGARVEHRLGSSDRADAHDLHLARRGPFSPRGDGSLRMTSALDRLGVAECVAREVSASPACTTVVTTDPCLLDALARWGCLRVDEPPGDARALACRVVQHAATPDLTSVTDLLSDPSLLPDHTRAALLRRLADRPSWLGDARGPLLSELDRAEPATWSPALAALLFATPRPDDGPDALPASLERWERLLSTSPSPVARDAAALLVNVAAGVASLPASLRAHDAARRVALRLLGPAPRAAVREVVGGPRWVPSARACIDPDDVYVVWMVDADTPTSRPLSSLQRRDLRAAGAPLDRWDARQEAARAASLRPLYLARHALQLFAAGDDDSRRHPLWRTLLLRAGGTVSPSMEAPPTDPRAVDPLPLPRGRRVWSLPPMSPPSVASPTAIETLLGCDLRPWLDARIPAPRSPSSGSPRVWGILAHEALAFALPHDEAPEAVAARAADYVARQGPSWDVSLAHPMSSGALSRLRDVVSRAAADLARRFPPPLRRTTEVSLHAETPTVAVSGRADLLIEPLGLVVDLKWSAGAFVRRLARGAAVQIGLYHWLRADRGGAVDAGGYYVLTQQRLLLAGDVPTGLPRVDGPAPSAVAQRARDAWEAVRLRIASGERWSPGAVEETSPPWIAAPCHTCRHDALCGRRFEAPR